MPSTTSTSTPVAGNDLNTGASPAEAWQTLVHAAYQAQVFTGERVIHLLPGTYTPQSSVLLRTGTHLVGEGGPTLTRIEFDGARGLRFQVEAGHPSIGRVQGITFHGGSAQTRSAVYWAGTNWSQRDVELTDCSFHEFPTAVVCHDLTARNCRFLDIDGPYGAINFNDQDFAASVTLEDCLFLRCSSVTQHYSCYGLGCQWVLERCRIGECGPYHPIQLDWTCHWMGQEFHLIARDSVFWGNSLAHVGTAAGSVVLERCTLDGNGTAGYPAYPLNSTAMRQCISVGHTQYDSPPTLNFAVVEECFLGDGVHAGVHGNITGPEPGFVNAATGDYRLRFGSPCVDVSAAAANSLDVRGRPRVVDGDLDEVPRLDLGAHELHTLSAPATVALGDPYRLELNGPAGEDYQLFFSRTGLAPFGTPTPFGRSFLPSTASRIEVGSYAAGGPREVSLAIPSHPALVNSTFAFQALARVPSLPAGAAWTQPATLTVTP